MISYLYIQPSFSTIPPFPCIYFCHDHYLSFRFYRPQMKLTPPLEIVRLFCLTWEINLLPQYLFLILLLFIFFRRERKRVIKPSGANTICVSVDIDIPEEAICTHMKNEITTLEKEIAAG